jgi:hypothetical protein
MKVGRYLAIGYTAPNQQIQKYARPFLHVVVGLG